MRRTSGAGVTATLALACVFGATLLLSLAVGAQIYRRVEERVEQSAGERVGLTYIAAKIHSSDGRGAITMRSFGGADAVCLLEELDGVAYETILYVYDGSLRELFCEQAWEPDPEAGEIIAPAQRMRVAGITPTLVRLEYTSADGRSATANVCLRSGKEMLSD